MTFQFVAAVVDLASMRKRVGWAWLIAGLCVSVEARAEAGSSDLVVPRSLKCEFTKSVGAMWKSDPPDVQLKATAGGINSLMFDNINEEGGTADFAGNMGIARIKLLSGPGLLHFVEITGSGNMVITSVFLGEPRTKAGWPAVHSRHMLMPGFEKETKTVVERAIVSQVYGRCRLPVES